MKSLVLSLLVALFCVGNLSAVKCKAGAHPVKIKDGTTKCWSCKNGFHYEKGNTHCVKNKAKGGKSSASSSKGKAVGARVE